MKNKTIEILTALTDKGKRIDIFLKLEFAPVAQLDRASDFGSEG